MASEREQIGLLTWAARLPVPLVRIHVWQWVRKVLESQGMKPDDALCLALEEIRKMPDGVAVLTPEQSKARGWDGLWTLLCVEVEYSAPISLKGLDEYADLHEAARESELPWAIKLMVVDHYGHGREIDLGALFVAMIMLDQQTHWKGRELVWPERVAAVLRV